MRRGATAHGDLAWRDGPWRLVWLLFGATARGTSCARDSAMPRRDATAAETARRRPSSFLCRQAKAGSVKRAPEGRNGGGSPPPGKRTFPRRRSARRVFFRGLCSLFVGKREREAASSKPRKQARAEAAAPPRRCRRRKPASCRPRVHLAGPTTTRSATRASETRLPPVPSRRRDDPGLQGSSGPPGCGPLTGPRRAAAALPATSASSSSASADAARARRRPRNRRPRNRRPPTTTDREARRAPTDEKRANGRTRARHLLLRRRGVEALRGADDAAEHAERVVAVAVAELAAVRVADGLRAERLDRVVERRGRLRVPVGVRPRRRAGPVALGPRGEARVDLGGGGFAGQEARRGRDAAVRTARIAAKLSVRARAAARLRASSSTWQAALSSPSATRTARCCQRGVARSAAEHRCVCGGGRRGASAKRSVDRRWPRSWRSTSTKVSSAFRTPGRAWSWKRGPHAFRTEKSPPWTWR